MISTHAPLATRFLGHLPTRPSAATLDEPDEAELIAASRKGDAQAYGSLVRKYQDRLCSSLRHVCSSPADAQDVAQEAFLRAYLKLSTYTGASAFYTWLHRIAMNIAISEHRRRQARTATEHTRTLELELLRDAPERPEDRMLREERIAHVQKALDNLSPEHRAILVLREIGDYDYDQIAEMLTIPIGTVRSRLHRARLELRNELQRLMPES
jgi:RNA polymerase sigma-70 factor, ECF subfamily